MALFAVRESHVSALFHCDITLTAFVVVLFVQVGVFRLLAEKHGALLDTLTINKSGLLHVACEAGALDIAKLLLEEHR